MPFLTQQADSRMSDDRLGEERWDARQALIATCITGQAASL